REPGSSRTVHALGYSFCGAAVDLEPSPADAHAARRAGARTSGPASEGGRCWLMWNERAIVLADGEHIVGRDPGCSVWLDASGVSRRHARIEVQRGGASVRVDDLGSKNGTFVDGVRIDTGVQVADGSVIQIGRVDLTLRVWSPGTSKETERITRSGGQSGLSSFRDR